MRGRTMDINKTHLSIDLAEDREIQHRDYIAHTLRWTHVIKCIDIGESILDIGCADASMGMMLYANKYKPARYVGVDIREGILEKARVKLEKANFPVEFACLNVITEFTKIPKYDYSIITCFEMVEHIEGQYVEGVLKNIASIMSDKTVFFLSTPNFDGKNKAENHIREWTYSELKEVIDKYFKIDKVFGTFMNQSALKKCWSIEEMVLFEKLHEYYDSNFLSVIFAPLHPIEARNCIWRLQKL
jgi:2-polyprenyl-3-methyl-5-hydroxy-6-metoxy-1,4-benzoquinol methylase